MVESLSTEVGDHQKILLSGSPPVMLASNCKLSPAQAEVVGPMSTSISGNISTVTFLVLSHPKPERYKYQVNHRYALRPLYPQYCRVNRGHQSPR